MAISTPSEQENYYTILGCDENSSIEQITTEYRLRAKDCHPDRVTEDHKKSDAEEKFMKLNRAHEVLKDPQTREIYDQWRRGGLCVPFDEFAALQKRMRPSMHWATKKKQPALAHQQDSNQTPLSMDQSSNSEPSVSNKSSLETFRESGEENSLLNKFRSYQL